MAQNYNFNAGFGFNVVNKNPKQKIIEKASAEITQQVDNLFSAVTNYVDKYENVLVGDVEKEINMYSRQMMIVGMNLKAADNTKKRFDMNI